MTDNPEGVFIRLNWYYHESTAERENGVRRRNTVYLGFEDPKDEQEFITLYEEWENVMRTI